MMALSNDSDTSRVASTSSRKRSFRPPWAYPAPRAATVTNSEIPKMRKAAKVLSDSRSR